MQQEKTERFALGSHAVTLKYQDFDELDADALTNINYSNIIGELLTFSVVLNRIGLLRAEAESLLNSKELDQKILYANLEKEYRELLVETITDAKGNEKQSKPTIDEVKNAIIRDPKHIHSYREMIEIERQKKIIESLYWSANNKAKSLEVLSAKIKPDDFENEIIQGAINGIKILLHKNVL